MGTKLLEDPGSDPARRSKTTLVDSSAGKTRLVAPVTSAAGASAPAADPIGMLADVLGRADARAGKLAEYADRARIAGDACVSAYESLK